MSCCATCLLPHFHPLGNFLLKSLHLKGGHDTSYKTTGPPASPVEEEEEKVGNRLAQKDQRTGNLLERARFREESHGVKDLEQRNEILML